jgi:hypothetical protein
MLSAVGVKVMLARNVWAGTSDHMLGCWSHERPPRATMKVTICVMDLPPNFNRGET